MNPTPTTRRLVWHQQGGPRDPWNTPATWIADGTRATYRIDYSTLTVYFSGAPLPLERHYDDVGAAKRGAAHFEKHGTLPGLARARIF
jgi:hypothetical protein